MVISNQVDKFSCHLNKTIVSVYIMEWNQDIAEYFMHDLLHIKISYWTKYYIIYNNIFDVSLDDW